MRAGASLIAAALGLLLAAGCTTAPAAPVEPPPADLRTRLRQAAAATLDRMQREEVRWDTRQSLQGDYEVFSENRAGRGDVHRRLHTIDNAREATFVELIEREGRWEVSVPATAAGTYRPYEVYLEPPQLHAELHRSRLRLFDASEESGLGESVREEGGYVIFRSEAPKEHRAAVDALGTSPLFADRERAKDRLAQLDRGVEHWFRLSDGTLAREIGPTIDLTLEPFQWGESAAGGVANANATGPRADPAPRPSERLELMSRCWGTDHRLPCTPDAVLVPLDHVATPRRLRAPGATEPLATFENKALVLMDTLRGRRAFVIDLKSDAMTPVGGPELEWGYTVLASVDSTGTQVVLGHQPVLSTGPIQLWRVSLNDGATRKVGTPLDATALEWHPERASVFVALEGAPPRIVRLAFDREGLEEITTGTDPVAIDPRRLLLRKGGLAVLFDLEAKTHKRVGDGFPGCGTPTLLPGRTDLLFVCRDRFRFVAVQHSLETGKRQVFPLPPGRYALPR